MAKRKGKANKGSAFGTAASNGAGDGAVAGAASRVRSGGLCARSSWGVPFLVVSREQLVAELPAPGPEDWRELLELVGSVVKQWEARGAVVLADFEGALTGFEGEPLTACFQRTLGMDGKSLRPLQGGGPSKEMGLLVDLRSEESAACAKRIMESDSVAKVIWGADNDVLSLRYTPVSRPLGISPVRVVDAQLGFSAPQKRLAMSAMLKRLPPKSLAGLPEKADAIDFRGAHAFNRRALHLPLERKEVAYALDDLHRLDAILRSQTPKVGSYLQAQSQSSSIVSLLLQNPASASAAKLQHYEELLARKTDLERQEVAVRAKRHLVAVRRALAQDFTADFASLEREADSVLQQAGVSIPDDLSFLPAGAEAVGVADATKQSKEAAEAPAEVEKPAAAEAAKEMPEAPPSEVARQEVRQEADAAHADKPAEEEAEEDGADEAPKKAAKRKAKKRKASAAPPASRAETAEGRSEAAAAAAVAPVAAAEQERSQVKKRKKRRAQEAGAEKP